MVSGTYAPERISHTTRIRTGATIRIRPGATIRIRTGATIRIRTGATIRIRTGATDPLPWGSYISYLGLSSQRNSFRIQIASDYCCLVPLEKQKANSTRGSH